MQRTARYDIRLGHAGGFGAAGGPGGAKIPAAVGGISDDIGRGPVDAVLLEDGGAEVAEHSLGVLAHPPDNHTLPVFQAGNSNM